MKKSANSGVHSPSIAAKACIVLVNFYRRYLSCLKPPCCRFTPTCSEYSVEAFRRHGFWRGVFLTLWRILRCHPFYSGSLVDPVPPAKGDTGYSDNQNSGQ